MVKIKDGDEGQLALKKQRERNWNGVTWVWKGTKTLKVLPELIQSKEYYIYYSKLCYKTYPHLVYEGRLFSGTVWWIQKFLTVTTREYPL